MKVEVFPEFASGFKNGRSYCEVQNFWLRLLLFTMVRWTMQENAMQLQETLNDKKEFFGEKVNKSSRGGFDSFFWIVTELPT